MSTGPLGAGGGSLTADVAAEGGAVTAFHVLAWVGFTALVVVLLLLDLFVLARGDREISFRRATALRRAGADP